MRMRMQLLAVAALTLVATGASAHYQRPDLAASVFPAVTIDPKLGKNAALTGTMVDLANYSSAVALVSEGYHVNSATAARYAVVFDSNAAAAATAYDSVLLDTLATTSTYQVVKVAYRGNKRWVRVLVRAGGTNDTMFVGAMILRGDRRHR